MMVDLKINQETVNTGTSLVFVGIVIGDIPANLAIQKVRFSSIRDSLLEADPLDWGRYLASLPASCLGPRCDFRNIHQESSGISCNTIPAWALRVWFHSGNFMVPHKVVYKKRIGQENGAIFYWELHGKFAQWFDCIWVVTSSGQGQFDWMAMALFSR